METMKIYLSTSGSVATLDKNFPLYQGSYSNVLVDIYVPKDILGEHYSVDIGCKSIDRGGIIHTSPKYFVLLNQEDVVHNGVTYNVFESLLPDEFTNHYGYGANAITMVINVTNSSTVDEKSVVDNIITSQEVKLDVLPSSRLVSPEIPLDQLQALQNAINDLQRLKQDKDDELLEGKIKNVVGAINSLYKTIHDEDGLLHNVSENTNQIGINANKIAEINTDLTDNIKPRLTKVDQQLNEAGGIVSQVEANNENLRGSNGLNKRVADLENQAISGIDRIGVIRQANQPATSQLTKFVADNTTPSREPRNGDFVEWVDTDNNKRYKIYFSNKMWQAPDEVDNIDNATNKYFGVVRGTMDDTSPKRGTKINILNGIIDSIYVLQKNGNYREIRDYLNANYDLITGIINGEWAVGKAVSAINDDVGDNIRTTYATKNDVDVRVGKIDKDIRDIENGVIQTGWAKKATTAVKAVSDIQNRPIMSTYAEKEEVYTKEQSDNKFLPLDYTYVYYYAKNGIVDTVPTDVTPQFDVAISSVGATQIFELDRVLANKYTFNKNTTDKSQLWISTDRFCSLKFRLTTYGVKGADVITLGVDTTGLLQFQPNQPRLVDLTTIYNQLEKEVELVVGNKIRKKLEVITDFSTATQVKLWCNETYPSTFNLVAKSLTFNVNEITGKKVHFIKASDWKSNGNGTYTCTITAKSLDLPPTNQYGIDLMYKVDNGWQRVLVTPIIKDNGDMVFTSDKAIECQLLVWVAVDIDRITEGGTRVFIGGEFVPDMSLPKPIEDMIDDAIRNTANRYKFNQLFDTATSTLPTANGLTVTNIYGGHHVMGTTDRQYYHKMYELATTQGHWYYFAPNFSNTKSVYILGHIDSTAFSTNKGKVFEGGSKFDAYIQIEKDKTMDFDVQPILVDLTEMFGEGNEPTTEDEVYKYFAKDTYYPYTNNASLTDLEPLQKFATAKVDLVPSITNLDELKTALYELRKSATRHYQLQEAEAKRVLKILGYPQGLSEDTSIFLYFDIPYSEAGGFEIVITCMGRNSSHLYKRTMYSTLNANWQDTGWTDVSTPMASKGDISDLVTKGNENWGMVPSATWEELALNIKIPSKTIKEIKIPQNGYVFLQSYTNLSNKMLVMGTESYNRIFPIAFYSDNAIGYFPMAKGTLLTLNNYGNTDVTINRIRLYHNKEIG